MISVIVPVYNSERYLKECIESVLGQSYKDIELLLVNDGSKDNSLSICKEYEKKDSRVEVINIEQNQGQVHAYKIGIKKSRGDFLMFIDSDDWISSEMINLLVKAQKQGDCDITCCGMWHIFPTKSILEPQNINSIKDKIYTNGEIKEALSTVRETNNFINEYIKFYRCNKLFKKKIVLDNYGYYDESIRVFEDNNFVVSCLIDANKVAYVPKPLYYYRRNDSSTMSTINLDIANSNHRWIADQESIYNNKGIEHDIRQDALMATVYTVIRTVMSNMPFKKKKEILVFAKRDIKKYDLSSMDYAKYNYNKTVSIVMKSVDLGFVLAACALGNINNIKKIIKRVLK